MADNTDLLEKTISPIENCFSPEGSYHLNQPQKDELLENTLYNLVPENNLTKRETEILNLILSGNTNKEISQKISRTERTIEYHRNRLMHKLGTKTAAELVKRAIALGIA